MNESALFRHQTEGIAAIQDVGRLLLADEPGLGKSRQAIQAVDGGYNLVVAPAMVLDGGTWEDEVAKWSRYPERWTFAPYTRLNRREVLASGGNRPIKGAVRPEFKGPWDALIVDEAHYTKNSKTNWTESIENLARDAGYVVELTGTPVTHWAHDLFPMLRVMHPQEAKPGREFGSYWRWAGQWFDIQPGRFGGPNARVIGDLKSCSRPCFDRPAHDPCEHYATFMQYNLGEHFLRRTRDECLDLPPITIQKIDVPMGPSAKRMYRELKTDFATDTASGKEVMSWSVGARTHNLLRLTTSPWLLDPNGLPHDGKFDRLRFDLENRTRPTVVFAHYKDTVAACSLVAESMGLRSAVINGDTPSESRRSIIREFQAERLDVLVGSMEVLAEGLTLTQADMAIVVEESFKPSRNEQARQRIHRIGQDRPVSVLQYVAPHSLDSRRHAVLATKSDRQMRMMTAGEFLELL